MKDRVMNTSVLMLLFFAAAAFGSHFNPAGSSVDSGEIRWGGSTTYTDARQWATDKWNALGAISIQPDTAFTIEDLTWQDADVCSASWDGRWTQYIGADTVELNKCYLKNYTDFKRRAVATHELGHGLGLGDHTLSDYSSSSIVMYNCSTCSGVNTPQTHDQSDYNSLW